jgi:hypothetical protein
MAVNDRSETASSMNAGVEAQARVQRYCALSNTS